MTIVAATPPTERKGFPLRLDSKASLAIERLAAIEFRSANAQIESMLRSRLSRSGPIPEASSAGRGAPRKAISLRLSKPFADLLESQANAESRSLNAHIEMLLTQELLARGMLKSADYPPHIEPPSHCA